MRCSICDAESIDEICPACTNEIREDLEGDEKDVTELSSLFYSRFQLQ